MNTTDIGQTIVISILGFALAGGGYFLFSEIKPLNREVERLQSEVRQIADLKTAESRLLSQINKLNVEQTELKRQIGRLIKSRVGGASADEIASILVDQYLPQLKGPKGDRGNPGLRGPAGIDGKKGEDGKTVAGTSSSSKAEIVKIALPENAFRKSITKGRFEWSYPECTRSGTDVNCKVIIRNKSGQADSTYWVYFKRNGSTAFSDVFTQHKPNSGYFANWVKQFDRDFYFNFPSGVTTPFYWTFSDVPSDSKGFQSIGVQTEYGTYTWKNVPIVN